jgi:hypothetical protein
MPPSEQHRVFRPEPYEWGRFDSGLALVIAVVAMFVLAPMLVLWWG